MDVLEKAPDDATAGHQDRVYSKRAWNWSRTSGQPSFAPTCGFTSSGSSLGVPGLVSSAARQDATDMPFLADEQVFGTDCSRGYKLGFASG